MQIVPSLIVKYFSDCCIVVASINHWKEVRGLNFNSLVAWIVNNVQSNSAAEKDPDKTVNFRYLAQCSLEKFLLKFNSFWFTLLFGFPEFLLFLLLYNMYGSYIISDEVEGSLSLTEHESSTEKTETLPETGSVSQENPPLVRRWQSSYLMRLNMKKGFSRDQSSIREGLPLLRWAYTGQWR